jgi:hypothetical protein
VLQEARNERTRHRLCLGGKIALDKVKQIDSDSRDPGSNPITPQIFITEL